MDYLQEIVKRIEDQLLISNEVILNKEEAEEVLAKIKAPDEQQQFSEF